MSDSTRSTGIPSSFAIKASSTASSRKSPWMNSTPPMPCIGRMSSANTRPLSPSRWRTSCDQPPGAAPRSTTTMPDFSSLSRSTNSSSLNTARERKPSACARFTNSSPKCSFNQRALLLLLGTELFHGRPPPPPIGNDGHHDTLTRLSDPPPGLKHGPDLLANPLPARSRASAEAGAADGRQRRHRGRAEGIGTGAGRPRADQGPLERWRPAGARGRARQADRVEPCRNRADHRPYRGTVPAQRRKTGNRAAALKRTMNIAPHQSFRRHEHIPLNPPSSGRGRKSAATPSSRSSPPFKGRGSPRSGGGMPKRMRYGNQDRRWN